MLSTMVRENLQMPYQGAGLSTPLTILALLEFFFFLSFFSFLLISSFTFSSFILCFVLCFHGLAAVYSGPGILNIFGHLVC